MLFPLYILLLGYDFIGSTFVSNSNDKIEKSTQGFKILSFNTQFFMGGKNNATNNEIKDWILSNGTDIMCFQEFYNNANSENRDIVQTLSEDKEFDFVFSTVNKKIDGPQSGVIIFSKFPIVKKGELLFSQNQYNRGCFADIKIGTDTIRVINVHLQSMNLSRDNPLYSNGLNESKSNIFSILRKLKYGLHESSVQAQELVRFIRRSPHKVIICGDFNQTPYSYVYHSFKQILNNAFEDAGNGFGVSYAGKTLFFLRIDHQFYNPQIKILDFNTLSKIKFSDHYPIVATYKL